MNTTATRAVIRNRRCWAALMVLGAAWLSACGSDDDSDGTETVEVPVIAADAKTNYAQIVLASYEDSLTTAQALDQSLQAFVATPSDQTLTAARDAWRASREPYLQTEVYRFYDGPIDNPDTGPEGLLNAWPLDENYIDYTATEAMAGIVNDTATTIDGASLESLNEKDGEKNIATGYHAIEFLLWGQDTSDTGPGERPHTDFLTDGSGTAANQDRRGQYVTVSSTLMLSHLQQMVDAAST
ncbi:MAG: imelysin family protein, partial [Myxococcota bacterium]